MQNSPNAFTVYRNKKGKFANFVFLELVNLPLKNNNKKKWLNNVSSELAKYLKLKSPTENSPSRHLWRSKKEGKISTWNKVGHSTKLEANTTLASQ